MDFCCPLINKRAETPVEIISSPPIPPNTDDDENIFTIRTRGTGGLPGDITNEDPTGCELDSFYNCVPLTGEVNETSSDSDGELTTTYRTTGVSLLQTYLRFLYYTGLGLYSDNIPRNKYIAKLQMVIFAVTIVLSVAYTLESIKVHTVGIEGTGTVLNFIFLAYPILNMTVRLMYVRVSLFKHDGLQCILDQFHLTTVEWRFPNMEKFITAVPYVMAGTTVAESLIRALFKLVSITDPEWSMEYAMLYRSYTLRRAMLVWSNEGWTNKTILGMIDKKTKTMTPENFLLGGLGMTMDFVNNLHQNACIYIFLSTTISLFIASSNLKFVLNKNGIVGQVTGSFDADLKNENKIWEVYASVIKLSNDIEETLGMLLLGSHIFYLILFGHFAWETIYLAPKNTPYWMVLAKALPVVLAYAFAIKIARKNEAFREWLRQNYYGRNVVINNKTIQTTVLLEDLTDNPIGIGRKWIYINGDFAMKFISVVASYFAFISERTG